MYVKEACPFSQGRYYISWDVRVPTFNQHNASALIHAFSPNPRDNGDLQSFFNFESTHKY